MLIIGVIFRFSGLVRLFGARSILGRTCEVELCFSKSRPPGPTGWWRAWAIRAKNMRAPALSRPSGDKWENIYKKFSKSRRSPGPIGDFPRRDPSPLLCPGQKNATIKCYSCLPRRPFWGSMPGTADQKSTPASRNASLTLLTIMLTEESLSFLGLSDF